MSICVCVCTYEGPRDQTQAVRHGIKCPSTLNSLAGLLLKWSSLSWKITESNFDVGMQKLVQYASYNLDLNWKKSLYIVKSFKMGEYDMYHPCEDFDSKPCLLRHFRI